jgi:2-polyprenyl-3-methyl-5-hydroxy-6-metoxy-1,4-benzoquinol methylase
MQTPQTTTDTPHLHYGEVYKEDKYAKRRLLKYVEILTPLLRPGLSVLDIGCYTAEIYALLPDYVDYWGMDFDKDAIAIARAKVSRPNQIVYCHFDKEPIALGRTFDVVLCTEVLEHLIDPNAMMRQICALVKQGGYMLISLLNENTIYHRLMAVFGFGVDSHAFKLYKHLHLPTIAQSEAFIRRYAKICKRDYYINASGKGSRFEFLEPLTSRLPTGFREYVARTAPGLFARGVIFLAQPL